MISTSHFDKCPSCFSALNPEPLQNKDAYWKLTCYSCTFEKFKCFCPQCESPIESEALQDLAEGIMMKCPSASCPNNQGFQMIRCPVQHCKQINFFGARLYKMGDRVCCTACQTNFQQVTCPHCLESNYWRGNNENFYTSGTVTECHACNRKFQHITCPHCSQPEYFTSSEYKCGKHCDCSYCGNKFQHALCAFCNYSNYYPQCDFQYDKRFTCQNQACGRDFKIQRCPTCSRNNYVQQHFSSQFENTLGHCMHCKVPFSVSPLASLNSEPTDPNMSELISWIQNNLNNPTTFLTSTNNRFVSADLPLLEETEEDDYEPEDLKSENACAVCMTRKPTIAFGPCGHKKTCAKCSNNILRAYSKKCPVCRVDIKMSLRIH